MKIARLASLFVSCLFIFSFSMAYADAWSTFRTPRVVNATWQSFPMSTTDYDRYSYPYMAGNLAIWIDETYLPNDGDTWNIRLSNLSTPNPPVVYTLIYDAASDCLVDNFGVLGCNITASAEDGYVVYWDFLVYFGTRCMREDLYAMSGEYNAQYLGASPYNIQPNDFTPGVPDVRFDRTEIAPEIPGSEDTGPGGPFPRSKDPGIQAERVTIQLRVKDDLGCNIRLDDEQIIARAEIVPESGSHRHFSGSDSKGTGSMHFLDVRPFSEEEDPARLEFEMLYETETFAYTAGKYGVKEKIIVEAPEARLPAIFEQEIDISVAAKTGPLVKLDGMGDWYDVLGSGNPGCDAEHNRSADDRDSDYLLPLARNLATSLAYDFFDRTGLKLKFNDASLSNGGFLDAGTSNRDAKCHSTHRVGIDVDLNSQPLNADVCLDGSGPRLESCAVKEFGYGENVAALQYLDELAETDYGAHYWRKHDREVSPLKIHYRFPR